MLGGAADGIIANYLYGTSPALVAHCGPRKHLVYRKGLWNGNDRLEYNVFSLLLLFLTRAEHIFEGCMENAALLRLLLCRDSHRADNFKIFVVHVADRLLWSVTFRINILALLTFSSVSAIIKQ